MSNFNNIWKNFLTEGGFGQGKPPKDKKSREFYKKQVIYLEEDDGNEILLKEVTEDELEHISRAINDMSPEEWAFNELFDGKSRLVIDFPVVDGGTPLGKFLNMWKKMNYEVDWEKGVVSATKELMDSSTAGVVKNIMGGGAERAGKKKKIQMKIGKWLAKVHEYMVKYEALYAEVERKKVDLGMHPQQYLSTAQVEEFLGPKMKDYWRLGDYINMMVSDERRQPQYSHQDSKRIAELKQYWTDNAKYIKENAGKAGTDKYSIIITRHPIDILRMADFEDITSCHTPPSGGGGGEYYKCAVAEAHGHGAVAYVVETEELLWATNTSNLESAEQEIQEGEVFNDPHRSGETGELQPVARLRLRQVRYYKDEEQLALQKKYTTIGDLAKMPDEEADELIKRLKQGGFEKLNTYAGTQLAVPEARVYGIAFPDFRSRLMRWARENQSEQLRTAPRDPNRPYTTHGEEKWQFGTIDLSMFIKFGGSYEDNAITGLVSDLFGAEMPATGIVKQDAATEDQLDDNLMVSMQQQYQTLCNEITDQYNQVLQQCEVGARVEDDGGGGIYVALDATMWIIWDEDEWITLPSYDDIDNALEEVKETWGFGWIDTDSFPPAMRQASSQTAGPITRRTLQFRISPEGLAGFDGQAFAIDHDGYANFCQSVQEECDEKREAVKLLLSNYFKNQGDMVGGAIMKLGREVENQERMLMHWEGHAEEGPEIEQYELVTFIAHPVIDYKQFGVNQERAVEILKSRNFWLGLRKRMTAVAHRNLEQRQADKYYPETGRAPQKREIKKYYPDICLDCDLIEDYDPEDDTLTANLILSVDDDAPDDVTWILRELVMAWDDQEELNRVANEKFATSIEASTLHGATLSGLFEDQAPRSPQKPQPASDTDMQELRTLNKTQRLLESLNTK